MKIYTKTGDAGDTGIFGGPRAPKDDPRVEACGSVDELNAWLGLCCARGLPGPLDEILTAAQHELFAFGAELATVDPARHGHHLLQSHHVERLERAIDQLEAECQPLTQFILPGGAEPAAALHLARTVCRRAERRVVTFARQVEVRPLLLAYLNRLGDLLFVAARAVNAALATPGVPWQKPLISS